jgi:hypothetical protein
MKKPKKKARSKPRAGVGIPRHVDRLYKAVDNYVRKTGGKLAVIGGVQIIQWPTDLKYNFTVGIKCTGTKPKYAPL